MYTLAAAAGCLRVRALGIWKLPRRPEMRYARLSASREPPDRHHSVGRGPSPSGCSRECVRAHSIHLDSSATLGPRISRPSK
jgi:hypothetical protein